MCSQTEIDPRVIFVCCVENRNDTEAANLASFIHSIKYKWYQRLGLNKKKTTLFYIYKAYKDIHTLWILPYLVTSPPPDSVWKSKAKRHIMSEKKDTFSFLLFKLKSVNYYVHLFKIPIHSYSHKWNQEQLHLYWD